MQIIDAHHHVWDLAANYHPWLSDRTVQFRYGDYTAIRRDYLPAYYLEDTAGFDVIGSVYVEAEWDPRDPLGEVEWVAEQREVYRLPSVMVAQAWLDREDAEDVLAAHGATPFVRGIRHKPRGRDLGEAIDAALPGSMGDPAWRRGYTMLAANGLSFDLQTPWWNLAEARRLADDFPDTLIVLNHTGLPADRSAEGLGGWREAMSLFAGAENTALKISGIGLPGRAWSVADNRRVVLDAIDIFGPGRCMFASNFPVDSLVGSFATICNGFLEITADFDASERTAMFAGNARRLYRIADADLRQG